MIARNNRTTSNRNDRTLRPASSGSLPEPLRGSGRLGRQKSAHPIDLSDLDGASVVGPKTRRGRLSTGRFLSSKETAKENSTFLLECSNVCLNTRYGCEHGCRALSSLFLGGKTWAWSSEGRSYIPAE